MAGVLIGRGKCGNRDAHGECLVKTEVETGVMRLQAKEHQGLLASTRIQNRGL